MKKWNPGQILLLAAAAAAIIGSILYIVLDGSDKTFHLLGFILALVGAASTAIGFTKLKFAPLVPAALYSAAFGLVLRLAMPSLSDVWNKVNFIGGNAAMGMTFSAVYLLCAALAVAACFLGTENASGSAN